MSRPMIQFSDEQVASAVRMLTRDQLDHEAICILARDRIRSLAAELDRLREELEKVRERERVMCKPPAHCPVTGRPFFMILEGEDGEEFATYGGPFDSYTIPEWNEEDKEFRSDRYDHDAGNWVEGGEPYPFIIVDESEQNVLLSKLDDVSAERDRLRAELEADLEASGSNAKAWQDTVCDEAIKRSQLLAEIGLAEQQRDAATARAEAAEAALAELREAANAVIDRLDSPVWKDQPHTAEFINRLRNAARGKS